MRERSYQAVLVQLGLQGAPSPEGQRLPAPPADGGEVSGSGSGVRGRAPRAYPTPSRRRRAWLLPALPAITAAAAALLLYIGGWLEPLPPHRLTVSGGDAELRRAAPPEVTGVRRYSRGTLLDLRLRPDRSMRGWVVVRAYQVRGPRVLPLAVDFERAADGVFRIARRVEDAVRFEPGTWDLVIVVGRPWQVPSGDEAVRRMVESAAEGGALRGPGWHATRTRIELLEGPPDGGQAPRPR